MSSKEIGIEEARKVLGDLITAAQQGADVTITRNGKPAARLIAHTPEDTMTTYTATIGADQIAFLTDTGSAWGCAGVLGHVASADELADPDTIVFDSAAAEVLRDLPEDCDGHLDDAGIWFGGAPHPVQVRR